MYVSAGISGLCMRKEVQGNRSNSKPILPGEEEMETNPRSKSAKLRVFERKV